MARINPFRERPVARGSLTQIRTWCRRLISDLFVDRDEALTLETTWFFEVKLPTACSVLARIWTRFLARVDMPVDDKQTRPFGIMKLDKELADRCLGSHFRHPSASEKRVLGVALC